MESELTKAEKEILEVLWEKKGWTSCKELVEYFHQSGKDWKRQTVNTFLTHLVEKGYAVKNGRKYIYTYTREEFGSFKAIELVETLYDGSLKKFLNALTGKNNPGKKYADELREYIDEFDEDEGV